jgi:O-antigen/teichoic acid export membrane protein
MLLSAAGYLFLYPLIIARFGADVLGLWSLMAAMATALLGADIGFSQLLQRDAGSDRTEPELRQAKADLISVRSVYVVLFSVLGLLVLSAGAIWARMAGDVYDSRRLTVSLAIMTVAVGARLAAQLDGAVLAARQDATYVHWLLGVAPVVTLGTALVGVYLAAPIEGLALGSLLGALVLLAAFSLRLRVHHPVWEHLAASVPVRARAGRAIAFARRGRSFYAISIGSLIRGPLLRFVVAWTLGLAAVAVLEVAFRVVNFARGLITAGTSPLLPTFAIFERTGNRSETLEVLELSFLVIVVFGTAALGTVVAVSTTLLPLWLGDFDPAVVPATRIVAVWGLLTLLNVPFWWHLQGVGDERYAAASVWSHTAALILLAPLALFVAFDVSDVVLYWTVAAAMTQILIFWRAHRRHDVLAPVFTSGRSLVILAASALFISVSFLVDVEGKMDVRTTVAALAPWFIALAAFLMVAGSTIRTPLLRFVKRRAPVT